MLALRRSGHIARAACACSSSGSARKLYRKAGQFNGIEVDPRRNQLHLGEMNDAPMQPCAIIHEARTRCDVFTTIRERLFQARDDFTVNRHVPTLECLLRARFPARREERSPYVASRIAIMYAKRTGSTPVALFCNLLFRRWSWLDGLH